MRFQLDPAGQRFGEIVVIGEPSDEGAAEEIVDGMDKGAVSAVCEADVASVVIPSAQDDFETGVSLGAASGVT